jgi:hypothetical protein
MRMIALPTQSGFSIRLAGNRLTVGSERRLYPHSCARNRTKSGSGVSDRSIRSRGGARQTQTAGSTSQKVEGNMIFPTAP